MKFKKNKQKKTTLYLDIINVILFKFQQHKKKEKKEDLNNRLHKFQKYLRTILK